MRSDKRCVVFVFTEEFLRTKAKTNPYIDPIVALCKENGIRYRFLTPKKISGGCGYDPALIETVQLLCGLALWFWRIVHLFWRVEPYRIYALFARITRFFIRNRFVADLVISSGSPMGELLSPLFCYSRVVDIQHGVIFSKHTGYFDKNGELTGLLKSMPNREFWLYGKGYADCFFRNPKNRADLEDRVKVIGDVVGHPALPLQDGRKVLAFSAQLTGDFTAEVSAEMVRRMRRFFEEAYAKYGSRLRYLLKQHPRFNHCDIEPLKALPYLEFTDAPWSELYPQMLVHVTFSSTVCFDCASCGIPTRFEPYPESNILDSRYYQDDYSYPYLDWSLEQILEEQTRDPDTLHRTIRAWYETCYTPFSKENCLKLLKGEM